MLAAMSNHRQDSLLVRNPSNASSSRTARISGIAFNPLKAASLRAQEILRRQNGPTSHPTPAPKLAISRPVLIDSSLDEDRISSLRRLSSLHTLVEVAEERPYTPPTRTSPTESEKALPSLPSDTDDNRPTSIAPSSVYSQATPPRDSNRRPSLDHLEHLTSASLTTVPSFDYFTSFIDEDSSDEDEMSRNWQAPADGSSSIPRPAQNIKTGISVRGMAAMLNSGQPAGDEKKESTSRPVSRSSSVRSRNWDEIFSKRATEKRNSQLEDSTRSASAASNSSGTATPVDNRPSSRTSDHAAKAPAEPWRGFSGRTSTVPPLINEEKEKAGAVFALPPRSTRRPSVATEESVAPIADVASTLPAAISTTTTSTATPEAPSTDDAIFVPPRSNRRPSPPPLTLPAEKQRSIVTRVPSREASMDQGELKPVPPLKIGGRTTPPTYPTSPTTPQTAAKMSTTPLMSPFTPSDTLAAAAYPSPVSSDPKRFVNINTAKEVKMTSVQNSSDTSDGSPKTSLVRVTSRRTNSGHNRSNSSLGRSESVQRPAPLRVPSRQEAPVEKPLSNAPAVPVAAPQEIKPISAPAPIMAQAQEPGRGEGQGQGQAPLAAVAAAPLAIARVQNPAPAGTSLPAQTTAVPVVKPAPMEVKPEVITAKPAVESKPPIGETPAAMTANPISLPLSALTSKSMITPAIARKEPSSETASVQPKERSLPGLPQTPVRREPARDILLDDSDDSLSPAMSEQSQQLPSRFSPSTYASTIKSTISPPPTPPQQQQRPQQTTFMSSNFSTPIPILDRSRQTFSGLPKAPSAGIARQPQVPRSVPTSAPQPVSQSLQNKPLPTEALVSQIPSSPPASPQTDNDSKPNTPSKLRLLPMPFPDGRPYSPPSPPQRPQSRDLIPRLEAEQGLLQLKKRSVEKQIAELSRVLPPNPSTHNIMARSEMNARREELKMELAGVMRDEHELGLKLHRAWKRRDKSTPFGGPTSLWVRRVGEGY